MKTQVYGLGARNENSPNVWIQPYDAIVMLHKGVHVGEMWKLQDAKVSNASRPRKDFIYTNFGPAVSERVMERLKNVVGESVEWLFLTTIKETDYYIMNVLTVVDCLDRSKSKAVLSVEDRSEVLSVSRAILDESRIPDAVIFCLPFSNIIFVKQPIVDAVKADFLRGACFFDPSQNLTYMQSHHIDTNVVPQLPL